MTDTQRAKDMRVILDYLRDRNDDRLQFGYEGDSPLTFMAWLRERDSSILREAVQTYGSTEAKYHYQNGRLKWGHGIDYLMEASKKNLDDTTTALGLFTAKIVDPMPKGPQAVRYGRVDGEILIHWELMEYVSGLYDTLRYHPDALSADHYALLMDGNILLAPEEASAGLTALLRVTNRIVQAELEDQFCVVSDQRQREEPYRHYTGYSDFGSVWLGNGDLVKYVLANSSNSTFIAEIIAERKTDDPAVIAEILEQGTVSLASGVL